MDGGKGGRRGKRQKMRFKEATSIARWEESGYNTYNYK